MNRQAYTALMLAADHAEALIEQLRAQLQHQAERAERAELRIEQLERSMQP